MAETTYNLSDLKAEIAAFREAEAAAPAGPYCDLTCPNDIDPDTYVYGYGELRTAPTDNGGWSVLLKVPDHEDYDTVLKFCAACRPSDDPLHWSRRMEWMVGRIEKLERERDAAVAQAERLERELSERKHLIHSLIDENGKLKAQVDKATIQCEHEKSGATA